VNHPILGRLHQALYPERDKGKNWKAGGEAEEQLAEYLEPLSEAGLVAFLHDCRIPGSRANIDHIAIAPSGIWVIDTKSYSGAIKREYRGSVFAGRNVLSVRGRDRTSLVEAVEAQRELVIASLRSTSGGVPVRAALCFVDGEWGWRVRPFWLSGVAITWPKALRSELERDGPVDASVRAELVDQLGVALPPALSD